MALAINLVTRGRPNKLLQTVQQTAKKLLRSDTVFMISIDDDDQPTLDILKKLNSIDPRVRLNVKPREDTVGAKCNRVLEVPADLYVGQGDYTIPAEHGFDQSLLNAAAFFPDGIGVVYSHMANASFPTVQALTHGLVKKLGYFFPDLYPYWFIDHHVDDIARIIGRIAFADVSYGLVDGVKPPTHERRDVCFWATFFDCLRVYRRKEAHAIIKSDDFQETALRKVLLLEHHPLIEYRSQWINDTVRATFAGTPNLDDGGPRYARVKQRAMKMLEKLKPEILAEIT